MPDPSVTSDRGTARRNCRGSACVPSSWGTRPLAYSPPCDPVRCIASFAAFTTSGGSAKVAAMIAAFSCGLAAFQTSGRNRIAWAFFAASAASWGGGEVAWAVYEVGMGVAVPFPSVADIGFLLAIPCGVIGVFAFTAAPSRLATRGEALLAGTIIALSLLFVAWALGLSKVYDQSAASPLVSQP